MDKILESILSAEVLTDATRKAISEGFKNFVEDFKADETKRIRAQLVESIADDFAKNRQMMIETVEETLSSVVADQFLQVKDSILEFQNLDEKYKLKYAEAKSDLISEFNNEKNALTQTLIGLVNESAAANSAKFYNTLVEAKQNRQGMEMFESFVKTFLQSDYDPAQTKKVIEQVKLESAAAAAKLAEHERLLAAKDNEIKSLKESVESKERQFIIEGCLAKVKGTNRDKLKFVLEHTDTDNIETESAKYISKMLAESRVNPTNTTASQPVSTPVNAGTVNNGNSNTVRTAGLSQSVNNEILTSDIFN